jgi:hypothetical protein
MRAMLLSKISDLNQNTAPLEAVEPKPLLMLCGGIDVDLPKSYSVHLYRRLSPLYGKTGAPQNLKLGIIDGTAHEVPPAMQERACAWLIKHLKS